MIPSIRTSYRNWLPVFVIIILFSFQPNLSGQEMSTREFEPEKLEGLTFRGIGPFRGGRSCAVTGVPGNPMLFYFGATGGGIWKTTDGGQRWNNISDGFFGGSIGAIAVADSDPNVIYVGGGEQTVRGNVSFGYGVWKSTDAGKTWVQKGLKTSRHISRIRIHPQNPEIAYAAVMGDLYQSSEDRGVYKTTNGGDNWEKILYANADAGAIDLIIDPNNSRVLYASTWRVRRTPYDFSSGGEGSALWKSTDNGKSWKDISAHQGLPGGIWGIVGIAVSPAKPDRVWAIVENKNGGVFRSENGGETWKKVNESRALRQRAWYYSRIYADPENADRVYVVNVRYHRSNDGGKTFKPYVAPHGDHHDLWIAPEDPNRMIIGDDGGAQVTYNMGESWSTYKNQPTAQFYRVTTDNHFPYRILAAQQDNSTIRIPHRTRADRIDERHWEPSAGGESAHIAVDPNNDEIVYGGSYGGYLTRKDHTREENRAINVWPDNPLGYGAEGMKYRFQWNFPVFFSPHNPKKLYAASNHLHVSTDEGHSWEIISPDLTRNDSSKLVSSGGPITKDNTGVEYYCTVFAAAESPYEKDLIWTGSDDGLVHVSKNGGQDWTNVTPKEMPEWAMINSLEIDPFHKGGVYLAVTLYKTGDYRPMIYKTEDYGQSWKLLVAGIGEEHFTRVIRADQEREGLLYAGTESGLYISFDDGKLWKPFQSNLPIVPITDMVVKENNLVIATQGRSLWVLDDLTPIREMTSNTLKKDVNLFTPKDSYRMKGGQNKKVKHAGMNHPSGVVTYIFLQEKLDSADVVTLGFYDAKGELIREFSNRAEKKADSLKLKKGLNAFQWDTRYPSATKVKKMILWWSQLAGPKALPGAYSVKLTYNDEVQEARFNILADPTSAATAEDRKAQFDFLMKNRDKMDEMHIAIQEIRKVRSQIKGFQEKIAGDSTFQALTEASKGVLDQMKSIEEALYQTKNRSRQDPLNFPIRLNNKLGHVGALTEVGDFAPTAQAVAVQKELIGQIDTQLALWEALKNKEVPSLNEQIQEAKVPVIRY